MTVAELIARLQQLDPNSLVVQSTNAEGSGFSPTFIINEGLYTPYSAWSGEFHDPETDPDYIPELGDKYALCLWPTN